MSINSLVIRNGIPVPVKREQFLHMEEGVSLDIGNDAGLKGKGKVYLTNYRLIFLRRSPLPGFSSFSLPYLFARNVKYNKKLMGSPVIAGTTTTVPNGGLQKQSSNQECKFQMQFHDSTQAKAFYTILERALNKAQQIPPNDTSTLEKYQQVTVTPTLAVEEIFPDQFAMYQKQQRIKVAHTKNVVIRNAGNPAKQQIVVGQSHNEAPMQLTQDYRAQKATLFASQQHSSASKSAKHHNAPHNKRSGGPIVGASPVNMAAFSKHRLGKTVIEDEAIKRSALPQQAAPQQPSHRANHQVHQKKAPRNKYDAYIDPSNPDDIVLSVPINDDTFDQNNEGKANEVGNGYMYGIGDASSEYKPPVPVPVAVEINDDEDDDGGAAAEAAEQKQKDEEQSNESIPIQPLPKPKDDKKKTRVLNNNNNNNNDNSNPFLDELSNVFVDESDVTSNPFLDVEKKPNSNDGTSSKQQKEEENTDW
eukprot:CAMPEP_0202726448 /NCGR_PEP_ID=MMETSP1385-20130828/184618_1 /ASSEMBLY_ACC=CAM_ASM_000861 /TAXON_ID=933848 /ORGANISM="Elphidium margaritaceum" /LENGTH=474 /DNA_ID=CAMNT_0049392669 /DNA_START=33 /DNA_END=1454 /DNA_ORIENTATION=-